MLTATILTAAVGLTSFHRIASPLGSGGIETMELFDNTNCEGEPTDMMGLDAEGLLGGVGQPFAMKQGKGIKVEYLDGSCVDYEKPMLTATLYEDSKCEGKPEAKVHLMEDHCVSVKGISIKFTSPLSNIDYCKYADLIKEVSKSDVSVKVWMPSDSCQGPPIKEVTQSTFGTRSKVDCEGCCFVPGNNDLGIPDAYTRIFFTCSKFKHIMVSMKYYSDDKCATVNANHPVTKMTEGKPYILGECTRAVLEDLHTTMSTMMSFTNPKVSPLFCDVVDILSKKKLPFFQGSFLKESDFNQTVGI